MNVKANSKNMLFVGTQHFGNLFGVPFSSVAKKEVNFRVVRTALDMFRDDVKKHNGTLVFNNLVTSNHFKYSSVGDYCESINAPVPNRAFNIERPKNEKATFLIESFHSYIASRFLKFANNDDIVIVANSIQVHYLKEALLEWEKNYKEYQSRKEKIAELEASKNSKTLNQDSIRRINNMIKDLRGQTSAPSFQMLVRLLRERNYSFGDNNAALWFRTFKPVMFFKDDVEIAIFRVEKEKYNYTPTSEDIFTWINAVNESGKLVSDRIIEQEQIIADENTPANIKEFARMKLRAFERMLDPMYETEQLNEAIQENIKKGFYELEYNEVDANIKLRYAFALYEFLCPLSNFSFKVRGLVPDMKAPYSLTELYTMEYEPLTSFPELEKVAANVIDSGLKPFVAPNPYTTAAMLASGLLEKTHTSEMSEVEKDNIELDDIGTGEPATLRFSMMKKEVATSSFSYSPTGDQIQITETKRSYVPVCSVFVPSRLELDIFNVQEN